MTEEEICEYFVSVDVAVGEETQTYKHCYAGACPEDHKYLESEEDKECMAACSTGYYVKGEKNLCVAECNEQEKRYTEADGMTQCTNECPVETFIDGQVCLKACP